MENKDKEIRLTQEHFEATKQKVVFYIDKFNSIYNFNMPMPNIFYDIKGTKAGVARMSPQGAYSLHFNPKIAGKDWKEFINNTVAHEVAHLAVFQWCKFNGKKLPDPHGARWNFMMREIGATPKRTHEIDVEDLKRRTSQFEYLCKCPSSPILVGPRIHNNIKSGKKQYSCIKCGTKLINGEKVINIGFSIPSPNGTTQVREF